MGGEFQVFRFKMHGWGECPHEPICVEGEEAAERLDGVSPHPVREWLEVGRVSSRADLSEGEEGAERLDGVSPHPVREWLEVGRVSSRADV